MHRSVATTLTVAFALTTAFAIAGCESGPPTVPPQVGQAGQTSQQARRTIAEQPGGAQSLSGSTGMSAGTAAGTSGTAATGAASTVSLTAAEQAFVIEAAQHGMAEVELGRLAEQRASRPAVRDFGRMMVQDHTRANQELMQIASRYGMSPPTTLPPSAQAAQRVLQQASGPEFDRQYLDQQMSGHVMQRALFQSAASGARNQDIRGFAQRTLTVIDRHIDELRRIAPVAMRTGS